jgi:hypothetical protein
MNYGYDCSDWPTEKRIKLARALRDSVAKFNTEAGMDNRNGAYVEQGGLYGAGAIRIRRITHAPQDLIDRYVEVWDTICQAVQNDTELPL